ncbi:vomeronasal 1 receptor 17 [Rattus norvegicus]|uniref:Vomeronasal type-1 receptor n=1 Tax=Rattus norvegicus TaxID=10116 RepID=A0A8I6A2U1_RAT|nr:vomeronasal 1 receptor 17 [Rattus norvegicus]|eukprot:NP_001161044.1 vomeronasal 1 receptor 17 [Rattus norvegicus]
MNASELSIGVIILSQTVIGVLANFFLLYHCMILYLTRYRLRSIDCVLMQLSVANILTILSKGIPQTIAAFGLKDFLNDIGCKLTFFVHKVGKSVCIGSTSFLSVLQAIIISPKDSRCPKLKVKVRKYICYSVWVIFFIISILNLLHLRAPYTNESTITLKSFVYCYCVRHDPTSDILHAVLVSGPDIIFLGLMLYTSGFTVLTLYRHKQKMQQMPRMNVSSISSPASRATKTILLLVSTFVSFYTISTLCHLLVVILYNPSWILVNVAAMSASFFPTVYPFLLMSHDSWALSFCLLLKRNR